LKNFIIILFVLFTSLAIAGETTEPFHATDDVNASSQGGKGFESDGSEVDLGLDEEPAKVQYEDPKKYYPKK